MHLALGHFLAAGQVDQVELALQAPPLGIVALHNQSEDHVGAGRAFVEVGFSDFLQDVSSFDERQCLRFSGDGMLREIVHHAAATACIFDFEFPSAPGQQVDQVLPIDLYHGAAQFCPHWHPPEDFPYD